MLMNKKCSKKKIKAPYISVKIETILFFNWVTLQQLRVNIVMMLRFDLNFDYDPYQFLCLSKIYRLSIC